MNQQESANGPVYFEVRRNGIRGYVPIHHVSRETLNRPQVDTVDARVQREMRRERRKRHMRLRKLRGWR